MPKLKLQQVILFSILSTSKSQSHFVSFLDVIGIPRYLNGNSPFWKHVTCRILLWISSGTLLKYTADLDGLASRPKLWTNVFSALLISKVKGTSPLLNNIKSSAKMRWFRPCLALVFEVAVSGWISLKHYLRKLWVFGKVVVVVAGNSWSRLWVAVVERYYK